MNVVSKYNIVSTANACSLQKQQNFEIVSMFQNFIYSTDYRFEIYTKTFSKGSFAKYKEIKFLFTSNRSKITS